MIDSWGMYDISNVFARKSAYVNGMNTMTKESSFFFFLNINVLFVFIPSALLHFMLKVPSSMIYLVSFNINTFLIPAFVISSYAVVEEQKSGYLQNIALLWIFALIFALHIPRSHCNDPDLIYSQININQSLAKIRRKIKEKEKGLYRRVHLNIRVRAIFFSKTQAFLSVLLIEMSAVFRRLCL